MFRDRVKEYPQLAENALKLFLSFTISCLCEALLSVYTSNNILKQIEFRRLEYQAVFH